MTIDIFKPIISHIVCLDRGTNIGITDGVNFDMPWGTTVKSDLRHFKNLTKHNIVIMGGNTYRSIGKPLTERDNFVLSSTVKKGYHKNLFISDNLEDLIRIAQNSAQIDKKDIFIIGGKQLYDATFDIIDKAYITTLGVDYSPKSLSNTYSSKYSFIKYDISKLDNFSMVSSTLLKDEKYPYEVLATEWRKEND